ncbi:MAG TPA: efflux RND transporter permease subunit, partial [Cytophagaceae bacterium]
ITSNSAQDFSTVLVEFNTDVNVAVAKQKVKDAIDEAKNDLPNDLPDDPRVIEMDVSQIPIMNVNVSGDMELDKLKFYADDLQDRIEALKEITRVDMVGALEREIQINVDNFKMEAANITMGDIERTVKYENITVSGGLIKMDGVRRSISIKGEYRDAQNMGDIIIRGASGAKVYLKDIAEVKDTHEEKETFARLDKKNVITLNVIKRSGENLINASDKIRAIVTDLQTNKYPKSLKIVITGDQSSKTRVTLHDLINTIIIGFILVTIILMFFMGTTNAIFVGLSVPLSMFIAFMLMPTLGFTLNMIVLFSFLLALGIVVDDAIVVIENTHRVFDNGKVPIKQAAKQAAGEIFLPVFSGTMTTLAPFIPLAFWKGVIGKFMFFLPITLIVTLLASLLVAYIINPVFAVDFMKPHHEGKTDKTLTRGFKITSIVFAVIALIFYISGNFGMGNLTVLAYILYVLNKFVFQDVIKNFQEKKWPAVQNSYERMLSWVLYKRRPAMFLIGTIVLFFLSIFLVAVTKPKVVFFPQGEPNFIFTYIKLPVGTDQNYTDSITRLVEQRVFKVVGEDNKDVESIISNVGLGVSENQGEPDMQLTPNKGKVTVAFVEFAERTGESTAKYLDKIREAVRGIPGAEISVDQERGGPPVGKAINIELQGDNYTDLITASDEVIKYINSKNIGGIEQLKSDVLKNKPEVSVEIDRQKANSEGISTGQIGMEIRNAVFGKEISKFRDENDEYPIQLRYAYDQRNDIEGLMNTKITYRDMAMGGMIRQIPLSSIATVRYTDTYGGIKRKNQKRIITISSNVLNGFNGNEIVQSITNSLQSYNAPEGVVIKMTGEQEDQKETGSFLSAALMVSLGLIFLILVTQFNSLGKPLIIISEILFSIIGVLLGFVIFGMSISIIMTGIGIIALAGIVVRNGILLVEFTEILEAQGMETRAAIIFAGKTRMTPVLLTATATILGLVPLAVGLNIDFVTLFTELNPHIFFGGDSVAFWGPLSWTMIFGLTFATFLTLILVPCMYYLVYGKMKNKKPRSAKQETQIAVV